MDHPTALSRHWVLDDALGRGRDVAWLGLLVVIGGGLAIGPPLPIAGALLLMAVIAAVGSPFAAAAAVAASTPFIFHPVHLHGEAFSLLELSLVAGSLGLAARLAMTMRSHELGSSLRTVISAWPLTVIAALVIALGALSLFTVADRRHLTESVRDLRVVIVEPVAALVLTRWSLRRGGERLLVLGLLGSGAAVALVALVQVATGHGEVIGNGVARATGPYPHPNNLALYLERVGLVAAALTLTESRRRRVFLPVALVIGCGLAATLSRGALLAAMAGGALLIAMLRPRRGWRWFAAAIGIVVVVFAIAAGSRLVSTGTSGMTSSRELIWRSSLRMIRDHPVFGVGLDQFLYQYAPRYVQPAGWPERYTSHPHDLVLDVWLRLGLAGLVLFGVLGALCLRNVLRLRRIGLGSVRSHLALAGAALLVGGGAHGLVDNGFFLPDLAVLTWIAIALIEPASPDMAPVAGPRT